MGCIYHPDRDSAARCEHCEADLCSSCTILVEDGRKLCHRCLLALSLKEVSNETNRLDQAQNDRRVGVHAKWRPNYSQLVLSIGTVLVIVLLGMYFHWNQTELKPKIILDPTQPVELLAGVQAALDHYFVTHGCRFPDSLHTLFPDFLSDQGENRRALRYLVYRPAKSEGYLIRIKPDSFVSGEDLIATTKGIRPVEEEQ